MKKLLTTLIAITLSFLAFSSPVKVPSMVKSSFPEHFPEAAGKVTWVKQKNGDLEAEFVMGQREVNAYFTRGDVLQEADIQIGWFKLPIATRASIENNLAGGRIERIMSVRENADVPYLVEVHKKTYLPRDVFFNERRFGRTSYIKILKSLVRVV